MNRHKMLMGTKDEVKPVRVPLKKKIVKFERELTSRELGLDGEDIETVILRLRQLQKTEKDKGCFTIKIRVFADYDEEAEIRLTTERYETPDEIAKREAAAIKREQQKAKREARIAQQVRDPEYQRSLINRMNSRVNGRQTRYKYV